MDALVKAAEAFQEYGPYFFTVLLGAAYWHQGKYVRELHTQNMEMSKEHIKATAAMTNAVTNLKEAVGSLKDLLKTLISK